VRLSRFSALCLLLLLPFGARADDIGPAQAEALQQQLKDWLAGLLGPSVKLPDLPWQISGERDHYLFTWPIPNLVTPAGDAAVTANVRPLDGGRWSIDSWQVPASGSFTMTIPDSSDPGNSVPMTIKFTVGKQDSHGVLDPNLATATTAHTEIGDLTVTTDNSKQRQEQRFDHYEVDSSLTPNANGRLDLVSNATVSGWKSASQMPNGMSMAIGVQTMHAAGQINGVNRDRVTALLAATGGLIGALPPDITTKDDKSAITPATRAQLRLIIDALQDIIGGVSIEETVDGLQVEIPGMGGMSMKHFLLGFGGDAPDGNLHAWLRLGLDDLASPSLPPKVATFLPHHIEIKPTVTGVQMADLHKLALDATEEGADSDSLQPDIEALFSHGGINLGLETMTFDLGPAKIEGTGQVTALSPDTWHGEARVTATGLDDLTAQARTNPDLQQALPVLIMLRGLAKPDGKKLVWDIVSDGPSVTVNGLDLSQLGGAGKPGEKPGQKPKR
jgi:hypothetical protein